MDETNKMKAALQIYVKTLKEKREKVRQAADRADTIRQVRRERLTPFQ